MRFIPLCILVAALPVASSAALAAEINIHVSAIEPARGGTLYVMLFSKDGYPKKHTKALEVLSVAADQSEMDFSFRTERDDIAVKVHHDEDGNSKVTKNWTGIYPAEGLGFSQGQRVRMTGAPSYRKSKVKKADFSEIIEIEMRYGKTSRQ